MGRNADGDDEIDDDAGDDGEESFLKDDGNRSSLGKWYGINELVVCKCDSFDIVVALELDRSIGIDVVAVVVDGFSLVFDNGGLDDAVLIPLVVGLTLRLESLSPVSSSSGRLFEDGTRIFSLVFVFVNEISSVLEDVGVLGSLNDRVFVAELGVTVVLDPRRLPLRRIRSLESCTGGINVNWFSRVEFVFVERISDLYLQFKKNIFFFSDHSLHCLIITEVVPNSVLLCSIMHRHKFCLKENNLVLWWSLIFHLFTYLSKLYWQQVHLDQITNCFMFSSVNFYTLRDFYLPLSVSFQTMPCKTTLVPGSHEPNEDSSVPDDWSIVDFLLFSSSSIRTFF